MNEYNPMFHRIAHESSAVRLIGKAIVEDCFYLMVEKYKPFKPAAE